MFLSNTKVRLSSFFVSKIKFCYTWVERVILLKTDFAILLNNFILIQMYLITRNSSLKAIIFSSVSRRLSRGLSSEVNPADKDQQENEEKTNDRLLCFYDDIF